MISLILVIINLCLLITSIHFINKYDKEVSKNLKLSSQIAYLESKYMTKLAVQKIEWELKLRQETIRNSEQITSLVTELMKN